MRPADSPAPVDTSVSDWSTPAELDGYRSTPDYATTVEYLERLASAFPGIVRIENFGKTGEGRDLKIVIASKGGVFEPMAIRSAGRPILLVQNSIHSGEMDGKDASLALLRDLVRNEERSRLLDHLTLVVIPVYNVDGHERRSNYSRINQNGPPSIGWRANATNLNLNRDYMKADAPETRAFLGMVRRWSPDFFVDNHVTDGADFQYDVTFALDATPDVAPATAAWVRDSVTPELVRRIDSTGHLAFPGPVFLRDESDPARGLAFHDNPPRFSTGYMILENRPGLLVELHMLKDYRTRVAGNYETLRALMEILNRDAKTLLSLNREADRAAEQLGAAQGSNPPFPLCLEKSGETRPVDFKGYEFERRPSSVSGAVRVIYRHTPRNEPVPLEFGAKVSVAVVPPVGYIVPPQWTRVIDVLEVHGVILHHTTAPWTGTVGRYRCSGMRWPDRPFEGRHPILRGGNVERQIGEFGTCELIREEVAFPAGSVVALLNQRLSKVVIHWLEPEAPDSALRWGLFDSVFEQKEFGEAYVLEELAERELGSDRTLRSTFERRLDSDSAFASDPGARLGFFYDRSPWAAANRVGEYPVGRLESLQGLPLG